MTIAGALFIVAGLLLIMRRPTLVLNLRRGKLRGIGGPVLVVVGILMVTGVISG